MQKQFLKQSITFDFFANAELMINATEMAEPYGKRIDNYLVNEQTQIFLQRLVQNKAKTDLIFPDSNPLNYRDLNQEKAWKITDLDTSFFLQTRRGNNGGTWMHRHLALDFAAWLDVDFRIWMIETIDEIITDNFRQLVENLQNKQRLENEYETLRQKVIAANNNPEAIRLIEIAEKKKQKIREGRKLYNTLKINFGKSN